jgi:hypothetical protein
MLIEQGAICIERSETHILAMFESYRAAFSFQRLWNAVTPVGIAEGLYRYPSYSLTDRVLEVAVSGQVILFRIFYFEAKNGKERSNNQKVVWHVGRSAQLHQSQYPAGKVFCACEASKIGR